MIYAFLRKLVQICLSVFFKKIVVNGKRNLPRKGPIIIAANHPNTFMDPLIIAAIGKQQMGFLANAGIFANPVLSRIFNYFHVIPVYRQKDIAEGEKPDNSKTFAKTIEYLDNKGSIIIFPEGNSYYELKLRKIKTGTARIALSYEESLGFNSDLKIIPVALDYSDALQFRSMVSVTIGEPFGTNKYKEQYEKDPFEAVKSLTTHIDKALSKHVTHTYEKDEEELLIRAHRFYYNYIDESVDLYHHPKKSLAFRKQMSDYLVILKIENRTLYDQLDDRLQRYFFRLNNEGLTPSFLKEKFMKKNKSLTYFGYFTELFLLFPLYVFGLISNFIPYALPEKIFNALRIDIEYKTSVEMVAGLFTFPLYYSLMVYLFRHYVSMELYLSVLLVIAMILSAFMAMYYYAQGQKFFRLIHFYFFMKTKRKIKLLELRDQIIQQFGQAREHFEIT